MAKKARVIVEITRTKRKGAQRYTFAIDKPGAANKETKREYYTRGRTAWRGALRQLHAWKVFLGHGHVGTKKAEPVWKCTVGRWIYEIQRINKYKAAKG